MEFFAHIQQITPFATQVFFQLQAFLPKAALLSKSLNLLLPLLRGGPLHDGDGAAIE